MCKNFSYILVGIHLYVGLINATFFMPAGCLHQFVRN